MTILVWWSRCSGYCKSANNGPGKIHCEVVDWPENRDYGLILYEEILK